MVKKKLTRKKSRGLAAIEAALVLPLVLLVTLGALRYGHIFLLAQQVTNAARNGARVAIRTGAVNADVQTAVGDLMTAAGMGGSGYALTLPADVKAIPLGGTVTVRITVPVANVGVLHVPLFTNIEPGNGNWNLVATVTMAKEG